MKSIPKILLPLMLVLIYSTLGMAQRGRGGNPEERAERQTQMMVDKLSLSTAQAEKIKVLNLDMAKKMRAAFQAADGDREARRASMKELRAAHQEELKKYLTTEQFQEWEKIQAERRKNRPNRRGDGPKPQNSEGTR